MSNKMVSAHGGRWSNQVKSLKIPENSEVVFYVQDGGILSNEDGYKILNQLQDGNEPGGNVVERVKAGDFTYNYSCWYAKEFAAACGVFEVGGDQVILDLQQYGEDNPLLLSELLAKYPDCTIYWICCREITEQGNKQLIHATGGWPHSKLLTSQLLTSQVASLSDDTTYSMNFDFTSAEQNTVLQYLQDNNYQLLGFKGAQGASQITVGVPTWFSIPFQQLFGQVSIQYSPLYKVYAFSQTDITVNTTIKMQALSDEYPLGTWLDFQSNGQFTRSSQGSAPADSISLTNQRPADTSPLTVGLAGLVSTPQGLQYSPFCAFTIAPQGSLTMTPLEKIILFAAQTDLQSGNVQANAAAPGCLFSFSNSIITYSLMIEDSTYQITNVPGTADVTEISSGESLRLLLNS